MVHLARRPQDLRSGGIAVDAVAPVSPTSSCRGIVQLSEDRPNALLEMLWIREAHNLCLDGVDLPPLLVDTPAGPIERVASAAERSEWERAWPKLWPQVVGPRLACRADQVVAIPCEGEYSRRISPNALLITGAARNDSAAYQRPLDSLR